MVEITGLTKKYGAKVVLDIPSLRMERGELVGLVGNNGAGKTTLLRLMLDLVRADAGTISSFGHAVSASEDWKEYTGGYLDESFLIDYLAPEEFFALVGETRGLTDGEVRAALAGFTPLFNGEIIHTRRTYIRDLSKGNMQKVGIVGALLGRPDVVLLDEPFAHLDPSSQIVLKRMLREMQQTIRPLILLSSHALPHVVDLCTRVLLLHNGRIVRDVRLSSNADRVLTELEHYFAGVSL